MKLFELKGWEIRPLKAAELPNILVIAYHSTCTGTPNPLPISWIPNEDPAVCWTCKNPVPDEIQTLVFLHDGIQS